MLPSFEVPAEYFYALHATMPISLSAETRYRMATLEDPERNRALMQTAVTNAIIELPEDPANPGSFITPEQAARRLEALGKTTGSPEAGLVAAGPAFLLVEDWLNFQVPEIDDFWDAVPTDHPSGHLYLLLFAIIEEDPTALITAVGLVFPFGSVTDLEALTVKNWRDFFELNSGLLPAFTLPGTSEERFRAFVRRLRQYFVVEPGEDDAIIEDGPSQPSFGVPSGALLEQVFVEYAALPPGTPFPLEAFLNEPGEERLRAAVEGVSTDPRTQCWLYDRARTLNHLSALTFGLGSNELMFSLEEALFARGFTSKESIASIPLSDFQDALTGTVAYPYAASIYDAAEGSVDSGGSGETPRRSVNADGQLINCVPPEHLSPLGPVAYLRDLLLLTVESTCEEPFPEGTSLASFLDGRRGPLGNLDVTHENLKAPLSFIDLVNENLEAMAATGTSAGVVYQTTRVELLDVIPEHSSPAVPVAQPAAYDVLRADLTAPLLPYSQPLDVARSYLKQMGSSRFSAMRHFREDITEFVLRPDPEPSGFRRHLFRYPVRIELAHEYLKIDPEETVLFEGVVVGDTLAQLYGFNSASGDWTTEVRQVSSFLERTGIRYCDLRQLVESGWLNLSLVLIGDEGPIEPPAECEPCCLNEWRLFIGDLSLEEGLRRLASIIRLWRKLQGLPGARYSFHELSDVAEVFAWFPSEGETNSEFIRQLAAFQMLRDDLCLKLVNPHAPTPESGASGAERTHLLSLWVPEASQRGWAIEHWIEALSIAARTRFHCCRRHATFLKLLEENLDQLSRLSGFDPIRPLATWDARPTHTLRFTEVLAKVYASTFGVGELSFLFTADDHLAGDDPLPLSSRNEALESPLDLPDDDETFSLWVLREKLLEVELSDDQVACWSWPRIVHSLEEDFGYPGELTPDHLQELAEHFFHTIVTGECCPPEEDFSHQYRVGPLTTSAAMWNTPPGGPFRYDPANGGELYTELPLTDEAVIEKLSRIRQLTVEEQAAVQHLYFAPRVALARFAFLFPNFIEADEALIQEPDEAKRWMYFQRAFALTHRRAGIVTEHLSAHVSAQTEQKRAATPELSWKLLKHLWADENKALADWENETGAPPDVTWKPHPSGGAFAALLGLLGTGLLGEVRSKQEDGTLLFRELRGPLDAFGAARNAKSAPFPTLVPALDREANLTFVTVRNGFASQNENGRNLGGADGFCITWTGVLLVEDSGPYVFHAGSPTPEGELPGPEGAEGQCWKVTLKRGQKTWRVIDHDGPGKKGSDLTCRRPFDLKRGAYSIEIELFKCPPNFEEKHQRPAQTGFVLKYAGPDTDDVLVALPARRLYVEFKDTTLAAGVEEGASEKVKEFLELFYRSTLRDVRRTYQRAFKALLFAHRLELSATPISDSGQSEIEYMLTQPQRFEGLSFTLGEGADADNYLPRRAWLNFNFLPVQDPYFPPVASEDHRVDPSLGRIQAMFDWWERLFDYTVMREATKHAPEGPAWLLFHEAFEQHPDDPVQLLRHIGVNLSFAQLVLRYFEAFEVQTSDLEDERWTIRVWRADQWIEQLLRDFFAQDIREARPDLWASNDPSVPGDATSGNANLVQFVQKGYLENGEPVRTEDLKQLNDGLRLRARAALVAYLITPAHDRVPLPGGGFARTAQELSEQLLLDVEAGLCQRASRIEEAVTAVQLFVQRARLGLEPGFEPAIDFTLLWDRRFVDLRTWQACTRRELYKENFIEWNELTAARCSESFRFFEERLRQATLTVAAPAGLVNFAGKRPPEHPGIALLQAKEPSVLGALPPPSAGHEHGFSILGVPDRHARPSWLAAPPLSEAGGMAGKLPYWIEAAIRLGVEFQRVAAAGLPMGSATFDLPCADAPPHCCHECGVIHPREMDEYYFWLLPTRYFDEPVNGQDAEAVVPPPETEGGTAWRNEDKIPQLLSWQSLPKVHLVWARVHNGELKQTRRSSEGVRIEVGATPKLKFVGRSADSLLFDVEGGFPPPGYPNVPNPGFRYDLPTDSAEVVPTAVPASAAPPTFLLGLPAYPYFLYFTSGAPLVPPSFFSQAVTAADTLRARCQFEAALKWYGEYFQPLDGDAGWCTEPYGSSCCNGAAPDDSTARKRAIVLHYLETLLEWGDALLGRHSPESFQHARLIFDTAARVLGAPPRTVVDAAHDVPASTVAVFQPVGAALNPRLLALYERTDDRLSLIHQCQNAQRLPNGTPNRDLQYFGDVMLTNGWQTDAQPCGDQAWCIPSCPYRFVFMVQRAMEITREVQSLGGLLLSAYEKGDAEYLASLRQGHEKQLLELALSIRQLQWRDADWQVQALEKTKEIAQTRRRYFQALIDFGLISREEAYRQLTLAGMDARTAGNVLATIGQFMHLIPDVYVGTLSFTHLPVGSKLAAVFAAMASVANTVADVLTSNAGLSLTEAGWERREDEWIHQVEVLDLEIEQIERQILGADRRRDIALQELNNHQRQIEQSGEVLDFLRDKFTAHELYLWLQKETAALHQKMYELALQTAHQAQKAFNFELGHLTEDFLGKGHWDDLHQGLLSGERLMANLRRMEKAHMDRNCREYELTKQVSLRELFPLALLELRLLGRCEIELPEWLFDLDYPGHYLRRIKNLSLTIPSVLGPMTGVHCRLTLLSSQTRIDPRLRGPLGRCCEKPDVDPMTKICGCCGHRHDADHEKASPEKTPIENGYAELADDPRFVKLYGAKEAIATSTAQDDTGLFELNFRDERYLPFEFHGAISRFRLDLPQENNYFDLSTITDAILQLRYTAREGGDVLRRAASQTTRQLLPDAGMRVLDVRQELPSEWYRFLNPPPDQRRKTLEFEVVRDWFPYLPGQPTLRVTHLEVFFEVAEPEDCEAFQHDPCQDCVVSQTLPEAERTLKITLPEKPGRSHDDKCRGATRAVEAVASAKWPGIYHGVLPLSLGPITSACDGPVVKIEFPKSIRCVARVFIVLGYETVSLPVPHQGMTHAGI